MIGKWSAKPTLDLLEDSVYKELNDEKLISAKLIFYSVSSVLHIIKTLATYKIMNTLENVILDLVDGLWREDEIASNFGLSEERAKEIWAVIQELRNKKN